MEKISKEDNVGICDLDLVGCDCNLQHTLKLKADNRGEWRAVAAN